jgi:hypothetical protein
VFTEVNEKRESRKSKVKKRTSKIHSNKIHSGKKQSLHTSSFSGSRENSHY